MQTATTFRKVDPARLVEMQDTPHPDTGEFPSLAKIVEMLAQETPPIEVTRSGVQQATTKYRAENGLPPAPRPGANILPWRLPKEFHYDYVGERLRRLAARERGITEQREDHAGRVHQLEELLERMGPHTVVAFDRSANDGAGGWVMRQKRPDEEVWYGVMAVKP